MEDTKKCVYCSEIILIDAKKCKHCGEILDAELKESTSKQSHTTVINNLQTPKWSSGTAALLSFIIPGAGQMYKGNVLAGLLWLVIVLIGYVFLILPGLILHVICIATAGSGNPYK